jgi:serine/threonine protein phosphatase PrpC
VNVESAQISLLGDRKENQDRVAIIPEDESLLLAAVDGMGGHANGARAAEVTLEVLAEAFYEVPRPIFDPQGFLTLVLARAHDAVVELGDGLVLDEKPRATCALCLVQESGAYWAHIGDSRIYQIRGSEVLERTRDHSHVELLLSQGLISEEEISEHPMRNFVECCLGGDAALPNMSITAKKELLPGDFLLACTDGMWSGVKDDEIGQVVGDQSTSAEDLLRTLVESAVARTTPHSDNTSAAALRWMG